MRLLIFFLVILWFLDEGLMQPPLTGMHSGQKGHFLHKILFEMSPKISNCVCKKFGAKINVVKKMANMSHCAPAAMLFQCNATT